MSILEKARELGLEIAHSRELAEMKAAELAMLQDPDARQIIEEFKEKQRIYQAIQAEGKQLSESQKRDVEDLEKRMIENPVIAEYFRAQQNFERILEQINSIIVQAIYGEHAECSDECCTTCSGCGEH